MFRVAILAAVSFVLGTQSIAASFDCAKAQSVPEVLICSDARLSAADEQLSTAYRAAFARTSDKSTLVHTQREWLKSYGVGTCKDSPCLLNAFVARERVLNRVSSDDRAAPWTGTYVRLFRGKVDPSATITLLRLADGRISVSGAAYWVGPNPGQVHSGEMMGEAIDTGKRAVLDADGCRSQFLLAERRLIVESDEGCGGLNLSFVGEYRRK